LRVKKKQHIDRVLREMQKEVESKSQKTEPIKSIGRYIGLQRAVKKDPEIDTNTEPETKMQTKLKMKAETEMESNLGKSGKQPPRRYIPTVKQWDELCRAKANTAAANKENTMAGKNPTRLQPDENATIQRAMVSSSLGNIMPTTNNNMSNNNKCDSNNGQYQNKDRELFKPRYRPPAPLVARSEKRRGNLTHVRNISRAFPNCGLLPTPSPFGDENPNDFTEQFFELPISNKSVKRYEMKELLDLEPQPQELVKPTFHQDLLMLGFLLD